MSKKIGILCVVAGLLGAASGVYLAFVDPVVVEERWSYPLSPTDFAWMQAWFVVQHIPLVLGLVVAGHAVGSSRAGRIGWQVGLTGMVILTLNEALAIIPRHESADSALVSTIGAVYGVASLLIAVGLMIGGAAAMRAGIWARGEALLLFVLGAWLLVPTLPAMFVSFLGARLSITGWMLLFAALGLVLIRRSARDAADSSLEGRRLVDRRVADLG